MGYASGLDIIVFMKTKKEKRQPEKKRQQMGNPLHGHSGGEGGGEWREAEAWSMK